MRQGVIAGVIGICAMWAYPGCQPHAVPASAQEAQQPLPLPGEAPESSSQPPQIDSMRTSKPSSEILRFSAEVEIDDKPGGKRFQGVWLVREDGQRWVTAYRALGFWKVFEGTTVNVVGSKYRPRGQAIGATHFQVETLTVDPQLGTPWIGLGPKETLMGHFQQEAGAAGTKLEGETWVVFISDANASYQLANTIEVGELNRPVQVTARAMTRSPFTAHRPGPTLWFIEVSEAPAG